MKCYISGVITFGNNLNSSKEKFLSAQGKLKREGYSYVVMPAMSVEDEKVREREYLTGKFLNNLKKLMECDVVYMMEGWWLSRCSSIENNVAKVLGKKIIYASNSEIMKIDELVRIVISTYSVTIEELLSDCRRQDLVECREHIAYILSQMGVRQAKIGEAINRKRTSVIHLLEKYSNDSKYDKIFQKRIEMINDKLEDKGFFNNGIKFV